MLRSTLRDPWDEDVSILSAENVNFAIETAGLGSRFAAAGIDLLLQFFIMGLIGIGVTNGLSYLPPLGNWGSWARAIGLALLGLVFFVILWGYYFLFEWLWDGQTPGKRWLGLRVMQTSGMPLTLWPALTRNLLRILDFLPPPYGLAALVAVLNPNNRRIGDMIAGTVVAQERHDATRNVLSIRDATDNFLAHAGAALHNATGVDILGKTAISTPTEVSDTASASPSPAPVEAPADANVTALQLKLNDQDYELLRDFLARREGLPLTTRSRLAISLATSLSYKLNAPPPPPPQVEPFLESLAAALRGATAPHDEPLR